jgi:acetyl esterase/lipase
MRAVVLLFVLCQSQVGQLFAQDTAVSMKVFTYKKSGGTELKMYMFYTAASQQEKDNIGMAFFHGGGWAFGDPSEFFEASKRYARLGYISFSVQYRLCRIQMEVIPTR